MGDESVEDQQDMAPEAGPLGELSTNSDPQENAPLKVVRDPGDLTTNVREDHNATHIPFRSWCRICVKSKGREDAHRNRRGEERRCMSTHAFDYRTFGQENDRDDTATAVVYKKRSHPKGFVDTFASEREHQTRG